LFAPAEFDDVHQRARPAGRAAESLSLCGLRRQVVSVTETNPYMKRYFATRQRLKVGLVVAGAVAGAVVGVALTVLGKIVAGAPPATMSNYVWNTVAFAMFGALIGPIVTWSALRRVPLWRTVVEPLIAGVAGAAIGVAVGSPALFLALIPVGIGAAAARLGFVYREKRLAYHLKDGGAV
jgi:hypothetical protein